MNEVNHRIAALSPTKRKLLERLASKSPDSGEPIAIVGMACRFPGAPNLDAYWSLIHNGIDASSEIPSSRWNVDDFFDATGEVAGKMSVRWGAFVDDVGTFDPMFFGISPREAAKMDPQQRLLLETTWESLEQGGFSPHDMRGSSTSVYVGIGGSDYSRIPIRWDNYFERIDAHTGTGNALSISANRLSYVFDFRGPSLAVDTACSSGLVAVHLAIRSLRSHECDTAVAGAVNLILTPETTIAFSKAMMLSPTGQCRPFDAGANGYVRGEGCGVVFLKRLADAVRDGDNVMAVLRGSSLNQDGRTSGITAPNGLAQKSVIQSALADAGLKTSDVSYVEAHGTGTPLGDPIEAQSLSEVFVRQSPDDAPCYLGSVKANVGHGETTAGIAGLIKVALMMQHQEIPKQTHLEELNSRISLDKSRLLIPRAPLAWNPGRTRIAGVSAFGFGGTNAHVIVEAASSIESPVLAESRPLHVLPLAAKTSDGLERLAEKYIDWFNEHPDASISDVCFTAGAGRAHFMHRAAILAPNVAQLRERLSDLTSGKSSSVVRRGSPSPTKRTKVAFLFSGQGSQYVGMGSELYETQPVFREALDECVAILQDHIGESLISVLNEDETENPKVNETKYTQPALFALEYALAKLWMSWGVEPAIVLGHSVGEYVAACVAGVFSLEDGLRLIANRARLMQELPRTGLMAVVFAEIERVTELLDGVVEHVSIAAHNGPQNCVISGRAEEVRSTVRRCEELDIKTQLLTVSHAFHSPLMEPILDEFYEIAQTIEYHVPEFPIVSNLTGEILTDAPTASYWRDHIRKGVQFATAIERLNDEEPDVLIELGPATTLLGMGRRCLPKSEAAWLPSLRQSLDPWQVILESLAECYVRGVAVDWRGFDRPWPRRRIELPTYPFERNRHWAEEGKKRTRSASQRGGVHPLLGWPLSTALPHTLFEVALHAKAPAFLADHQVQGSVVLPAAAYIEQALAAAEQVFESEHPVVENLSIQQPMLLDNERIVQVSLAPENNGRRAFEIYSSRSDASAEDQSWSLHASGSVRAGNTIDDSEPESSIDVEAIRERLTDQTPKDEFYETMAARALVYGQAFQVLNRICSSGQEALASVQLPPQVTADLAKFHLHPCLLDGFMQVAAGIVPRESDGTRSPYTYLPTSVERVSVYRRPTEQEMWIYAAPISPNDQPSPESVNGNVLLVDSQGQVIAKLHGVRLQRAGRSAAAENGSNPNDWLYHLDWELQAANESTSNGSTKPSISRWLVFADEAGIGNELIAQLKREGGTCARVSPGEGFLHIGDEESGDDDKYEIDPLSESDYAQLLEKWLPQDRSGCGIIHLWSVDAENPGDRGAGLADAHRLGCQCVLALVKQVSRVTTGTRMHVTVATRGAQAVAGQASVAVAQSPIWGLGRVAANEHPDMSFRLLDLDLEDDSSRSAELLASELLDPLEDGQVAFRGGERYVPRLQRAPDLDQSDSRGSLSSKPPSAPFRLRLGRPGTFESLGYESFQRMGLGKGQVEVEVRCAGLNFSDILKAMGLYPGITDEIVPLGIECSGTVTAVGPEVVDFKIGDEVMGVAPYSLASHAITADYCLVHRPEHLSDEDACTIPITFLTAYFGLCQLADLQPGEKVLVHAAAGGVGQAAIQIAQHIGAEIFATAGSEEKREFLRTLGVKHVFNTRTLEFADEILQVTDRRGVDVVLNSLPGEAITKSLSILAAYGRFLEIGKIDIYQNRMIGLLPFQDNLSYHAIDLDRMLRQRPALIGDLFQKVMQHFEQHDYKPLPRNQFAADEVVDAFRFMAQRKNIGKVVISTEWECDNGEENSDELVRNDGSYLVTGGLGALGRWTAQWLAGQGAKHLVLLSRRPAGSEATRTIEALCDEGVQVAVVNGDVAEFDSLQSALKQIPGDFPPLRGVIHAAGVLEDGLIRAMEFEQLDRVMKPKVQGAWNLHQLTAEEPLDFFVMYSSISSLIGTPGQANYAAGNAFLDAMAEFRRANGLPGTTVRWGPWADAGMAAQSAHRSVSARGLQPLPADGALSALGIVMRGENSDTIVLDANWEDLLSRMPRQLVKVLEGAADIGAAANGGGAELDLEFCQTLRDAEPADRESLLQQYILENIAAIMSIQPEAIQVDQPLGYLGLDSLLAMELNVKLEKKLGVSLPMSALAENPTIVSLAQHALRSLIPQGELGTDDEMKSESTGKSAVDSRLIQLSSKGEGQPLFCVHPFGGDVRCYFDLARQMGEKRPVYAMRAAGLDSSEAPHRSIQKMAAEYMRAIRQVQPNGPYHLLGWSSGGIYAYEIALQMKAEELNVGSLVFIDTPLPSFLSGADLKDEARFLYELVNFSNWFAGTKVQISYEELRSLDPGEALERVLKEAKTNHVLPEDATVDRLQTMIEVCRAHVECILNYEIEPIDQPILQMRPEDTSALPKTSEHSLTKDLGWQQILGERLTVCTVSGDHFSMMTGDNVIQLEKRLSEFLKATAANESPSIPPIAEAEEPAS